MLTTLRFRPLTLLLLAGGALSLPATAVASPRIGIISYLSKTTFRPSGSVSTATEAILHGVFSVATTVGKTPTYGPPQQGYLYLKCKASELAMCRLQWSDLAKYGTNTTKCEMFGDATVSNPRVRKDSETPANPDDYHLGFGVSRNTSGLGKCAALKTAAGATADAGVPPKKDASAPARDAAPPAADRGTAPAADAGVTTPKPDSGAAGPKATDDGGCSLGGSGEPAGAAALLALAFAVAHRRRR